MGIPKWPHLERRSFVAHAIEQSANLSIADWLLTVHAKRHPKQLLMSILSKSNDRGFQMIHWLAGPAISLAESFIDNVIRDKVTEPAIGSVVYCDLAGGHAEHSGIYVGHRQIVHLDGSGLIETVSPAQFLERLSGANIAITIYVSCRGPDPVGSPIVAQRAKSKIGSRRQYNLLRDNCHQFSSGCLNGTFDNADNFMVLLKSRCADVLRANTWRSWDHGVYG